MEKSSASSRTCPDQSLSQASIRSRFARRDRIVVALPAAAHAGKLSWLDELVQDVILEAKAGGKSLVRGGDGAQDRDPQGRPALCDPRGR